MFSYIWNRWFKDSETILLARATALVGFLVAAMGAIEWSPLLSVGMDFSWKQLMVIGGTMLVQGLVTELARRFRATDL